MDVGSSSQRCAPRTAHGYIEVQIASFRQTGPAGRTAWRRRASSAGMCMPTTAWPVLVSVVRTTRVCCARAPVRVSTCSGARRLCYLLTCCVQALVLGSSEGQCQSNVLGVVMIPGCTHPCSKAQPGAKSTSARRHTALAGELFALLCKLCAPLHLLQRRYS